MNANTVNIYKSSTPYVVRASGGIIAETKSALIYAVDGQSDVVFFPREDIAGPLFDPSETESIDPKLGKAQYFHLAGKSGQLDDVAWSYDAPDLPDLNALKNYVTFDANKVAVEAF